MRQKFHVFVLMATGLSVASPDLAWAYVGPGAGLGAVGALLALLAALLLAIIGLVWYPLKRLYRRSRTLRKSRPQAGSS